MGLRPEFCRVQATLTPSRDSDIKVEVWLPTDGWNGKFVGIGNGIWAGQLSYSQLADPLSKGYAVATSRETVWRERRICASATR